MFQAFKELRAAKGRTLLITGTVGMIAVLVSFLTALTGGLAHQSISELDRLSAGDIKNTSLVIADTGVPSLAASTLTENQVTELGGTPIYTSRTKAGDTPAMVVSNPDVARGEARVSTKLYGDHQEIKLASEDLKVTGDIGDVWLDHQPIVEVNPQDVAPFTQGPSAVIIHGAAPKVDGTTVLKGKDIYKTSASYTGENMSLSTMTYLLFVISALVVGAFFTVWTMQRLRGVAISSALGAARKVIVADAIAQALFVLIIGVGAGVGLTTVVAQLISGAMPVAVSLNTTLVPGLILVAFGLIGAGISLRPILSIDPRTALNAA